jgi:hypothetical protein
MDVNQNIEYVNKAIAYIVMMDDCGTYQEQIDCMKILCSLRENLQNEMS